MPVIEIDHITRAMVREHPDWLFLFGDNEARAGFGGQAGECRGEPNAVGVRTKREPSMRARAFWTDADLGRVMHFIDRDLRRAFQHVGQGGTVVVPTAGLGTGLAQLPERAPLINQYIRGRLTDLVEVANG